MADIPLLRFALPIVFGVVLSQFLNQFFIGSLFILIALLFLIFLLHLFLKRKPRIQLQSICSLLIYLAFFNLGYLSHSSSVINLSPQFFKPSEPEGLIIRLEEKHRSKPNLIVGEFSLYERLEDDFQQYAQFRVSLEKDSSVEELELGDLILVWAKPELFPPSVLPFDFNQRNYYASKNIDYHFKVKQSQWLHYKKGALKFKGIALSIKEKLIANVERRKIAKDLKAFLIALTLGDRTELDRKVKQSFIQTGSMHVLAVSGLHVGVLYVVLINLLRFKENSKQWFKAIIILLLVWSYAMICGMGKPVQRASIMLSVLLLSRVLNRQNSSYNALILSGLIILAIEPLALFTVSFQFSFLALLSIMLFYSKIKSVLLFKSEVIDKLWSMAALGISAQILSFPLSIYYFHQFPPSFILSNVVVVPYAIILFHLALAHIFIAVQIPYLNSVLEGYMEVLYRFILTLNNSIAELPYAMIKGLHFSLLELVVCYLVMLVFFAFIWAKKPLIYGLFFAVISSYIFNPFEIHKFKNQVILFKFYSYKNVMLRSQEQTVFIADVRLLNNEYFMGRYLQKYLEYYEINNYQLLPLQLLNIDNYQSDKVLIVNNLVYFANSILRIDNTTKIANLNSVDLRLDMVEMKVENYAKDSWEMVEYTIP